MHGRFVVSRWWPQPGNGRMHPSWTSLRRPTLARIDPCNPRQNSKCLMSLAWRLFPVRRAWRRKRSSCPPSQWPLKCAWRPRSSGARRRSPSQSSPLHRQIRSQLTAGDEPRESSGSSRRHWSRRRRARGRNLISKRSRGYSPRCQGIPLSGRCAAGSRDSCMAMSTSSGRPGIRFFSSPTPVGLCLPGQRLQAAVRIQRRYRGNAVARPCSRQTTRGCTTPTGLAAKRCRPQAP
jgi:hypothetical protein